MLLEHLFPDDYLYLDPWTFDQDPSIGWRSFAASRQSYAIVNYIKHHAKELATWNSSTEMSDDHHLPPYIMLFHLSQVYALKNETQKAITILDELSSVDDKQFSAYAAATTAFLRKDKAAFDKLAALPNYNNDCMRRLALNWGLPYSKAYQGEA